MKITLLAVGKTRDAYLCEGVAKYVARMAHYAAFTYIETADAKTTKGTSEEDIRGHEATLILKHISPSDFVVLFDERGKETDSVKFSSQLEKKIVSGVPHIVFIIGGPYGVHRSITERANEILSLSKMTFSHQMVRLFAIEQLYRAFTIMKGEPYHHA